MAGTLLVRLKPHNPKAGHVLKRYTFKGVRFQVDRGWYEVPEALAEELRGKRQRSHNEHSPAAFDVCTPAEAQALERREKEAAEIRRDATSPIRVNVPEPEEDAGDESPAAAPAGRPAVRPAAAAKAATPAHRRKAGK